MKTKPQDYYTTNRFQESGEFKFVEFESDVPKAILDGGSYPFGLRMPVQKGWSKATHRLLVVIQHVDSADLKSKELASATAGVALTNVLKYTRNWYRDLTDETIDFSIGIVNFNYAKTYHLDSKEYEVMSQLNGARVREAVDWLDPTHVFIVGDEAACYTLNKPYEQVLMQRGWVSTIDGRKYAHTIDINRCYSTSSYTEDDDDGDDDEVIDYGGGNKDRKLVANANLMGFVCRNLLSLYFGKLPFHISKIVPNVRVVDTIERFDKLMGILDEATAVSFDSETKNLTVLNNKLLVFQFAVDTKVGYVLPVDHPDAPWSDKERKYIKGRLRDFFLQPIELTLAEDQRYIIGHNLKFDLKVVRQGLGIPVISWPVWDTMAGSFCLEENMGALKTFGMPYGNLGALCCYLGNDFYHTKDGFSKEDRTDIENQDFYDPTFLDYCFEPNTQVVTETGVFPIRDIVVNPEKYGRALSYNHDTQKVEFKSILLGLERPNTDDMVEVAFDGGTVLVTEDHEFWSVTRNCYIKAIDMQEGEEVLVVHQSLDL